jgi:hypothetical protein
MFQTTAWIAWSALLGAVLLTSLWVWKGWVSGCATSALVAAFLFLGLFTWGSGIHWVGAKDLEITFVVTELGTGQRVSDAKVEIVAGDAPFCDGSRKPPFHLVTDADGVVRSFHKQCMCFGTEGWIKWRRVDTFAMHIPDWVVRVSAPGYAASGEFQLGNFQRGLERGQDFAKLEIPVTLAKLQ